MAASADDAALVGACGGGGAAEDAWDAAAWDAVMALMTLATNARVRRSAGQSACVRRSSQVMPTASAGFNEAAFAMKERRGSFQDGPICRRLIDGGQQIRPVRQTEATRGLRSSSTAPASFTSQGGGTQKATC